MRIRRDLNSSERGLAIKIAVFAAFSALLFEFGEENPLFLAVFSPFRAVLGYKGAFLGCFGGRICYKMVFWGSNLL
jgi:hypothetical protein